VGIAAKKSPEVECRQIAGLVADYLDGILQQRTAELLGRHIDGCHTCVGFVNTYRETIRAIRGLRQIEGPCELKKRLSRQVTGRDVADSATGRSGSPATPTGCPSYRD